MGHRLIKLRGFGPPGKVRDGVDLGDPFVPVTSDRWTILRGAPNPRVSDTAFYDFKEVDSLEGLKVHDPEMSLAQIKARDEEERAEALAIRRAKEARQRAETEMTIEAREKAQADKVERYRKPLEAERVANAKLRAERVAARREAATRDVHGGLALRALVLAASRMLEAVSIGTTI